MVNDTFSFIGSPYEKYHRLDVSSSCWILASEKVGYVSSALQISQDGWLTKSSCKFVTCNLASSAKKEL